MRAFEIITEDAKQKSIVIRQLNKLPDDNPLFNEIYKDLIKTPLGNRITNFINARKDQDAISATQFLLKIIPQSGTSKEVKEFMQSFSDPEKEYVKIDNLIPSGGMQSPAPLGDLVDDPFAKKLFDKLFGYKGKGDAGPGEAALAVMSPNITYGAPGDIVVSGKKIEVKASNNQGGAAGRIWDMPVHQPPMLKILEPLGIQSFSVMMGTNDFPGDDETKSAFIKAACEGWFGKERPEIEKVFGKKDFKDVWQAAVFDAYKEHAGWEGVLAIGLTSYQYVQTGEQFAKYMGKKNQGNLCRATEKQPRALAPQILIK